MALFKGFIGPSYQSQSPIADGEMLMNFYVEPIESGAGKSAAVLYPTPGLKTFAALSTFPIRRLFKINGRVFAVGGENLTELLEDGTVTVRGVIQNDGLPVSMASNGAQLFIVSAGVPYVLDLTTLNLLIPPVVSNNQLAAGAFSDGYFIALRKDSRTFQVSALENAMIWDDLDVEVVSLFPDQIVSMLVDHREIWMFGRKKTTVYFNSGNPDFPFEPVQGSYIEQGIAAKDTPTRLDNSLYWLGADERGQGIAWRAHGYTPARVSNHAVEYAISQYARIDDAVGYGYQDQGHSFYVLYFPTPSKTWVLDVSTNMWHERGFWDTNTGFYTAHRSQCHVFAFGKHLVGDYQSGAVYEMGINIYKDGDALIRRLRRCPHISNEQRRMFYSDFQLDVEVGLGLEIPPAGPGAAEPVGTDPKVMLRWSNNGGKTWSNEHWKSAGKAGQYGRRAIWRRLGAGRDRVFEAVVTDPIPWRFITAYVNAQAGTS